MNKIIYFLAILAVSGLSCDKNKVFEKYISIENHKWKFDHIITFNVDIIDNTVPYDILLAIRHSTYYAFANIKVVVITKSPDGEKRIQNMNTFLKSSDGAFLGDGAGDLWDFTTPVYEKFMFSKSGIYTIEVHNAMPMYELPNVLDIGLIVRKAK